MAKFTDAKGRDWRLAIPNFRVVVAIREATGFDLNRVGHDDGGLSDLVYGDAERVVNTAWLLAAEKPTGVGPDEFAESIDRDALARLRLAVAEATFDFFHHCRAGAMIAPLRRMLLTPDGSTASGGTLPGSAG